MNVTSMQLKNVLDGTMFLNVLLVKIQPYFSVNSFRRERFCILYSCMSLVFNNEYNLLAFALGIKRNRMNKSCMSDVS